MGGRGVAALTIALLAAAAPGDELDRARQLAWDKQFAASEALYRVILESDPTSRDARLGLARVVMWQGRYAEAIERFEALGPADADALEGRGTAEYWSGDYRRAARTFLRVLALDPKRDFARRSLDEIRSTALPSQRVAFDGGRDDQPLDTLRAESSATFFSDPLTRWTVNAGTYQMETERLSRRSGQYASIANETAFPAARLTLSGHAGLFEFPDGVVRPVGSAAIRYRNLTLRTERLPILATASSLDTHAAATKTSLRWSRESETKWIAAIEANHLRYFDDNSSAGASGYIVAPVLRRGGWTLWAGASAMARDTDESRFQLDAASSVRLPSGLFRYSYRGHHEPYWTPDDLREARLVAALERKLARGRIKLFGDGGMARDRGRAFGPGAGAEPLPTNVFIFAFDRDYRPWRAGITADVAIASHLVLEMGVERAATVDYRSTSFHAALVRRR